MIMFGVIIFTAWRKYQFTKLPSLIPNNQIFKIIYCSHKIYNFKLATLELSNPRTLKHSNKKKGQVTHIAPLQPLALASFPTWGSSEGAGRTRLTPAQKYKLFYVPQ
jgi:hypothetical protein